MDLFENSADNMRNQPLAYRMRPRTLDEYIGQDHIVGPGRLLRRSIQADQLSSVIFYGPPGTGKTTLARVIANTTKSHFSTINAVLSGVKDLREEIDAARERLRLYGKRTILFVDEVHRWNKSQQDALLPWVENGTFILIGATTENPFFEVNAALVSRSRIFQLKSLTDDDLMAIARQAIADKERGYGNKDIAFEEGALEHLVDVASGDARSLLNALELAVETTEPGPDGKILITKDAAEESIQRKAVLYDKEGDYHFDVISAFIKSLRGSDPDAALYWLAKMVHAGEDPRFIFRRMMISACEDVGLADPNAIVVVTSDAEAFDRIGMPEGRYHLTHAALYLATAPKSNSEMGFFDALKVVEEEAEAEVPNHLRDASRDSKGFGHGEGYMYPHAYRDHWVAQQYLPNVLQGKVFYHVGSIGYEKQIADTINRRREIQLESVDINAFPESLTFSPGDKGRELWVRRTAYERSEALTRMRDIMFSKVSMLRSDRVLVLNAGHGLLVWEAYRRTPEGLVLATVSSNEDRSYIQHYIDQLDAVQAPQVTQKPVADLEKGLVFEHILGRNIDLCDDNLETIASRMKDDATLVLCQTLKGEGSRLSSFVHESVLKDMLLKAEKTIYTDIGRQGVLSQLGKFFTITSSEDFSFNESRRATPSDVTRWVEKSYAPVLGLSQAETEKLTKELSALLCASDLNWSTVSVILTLKKIS